MQHPHRTEYLAECFWPGVHESDLIALDDRVNASAAELLADGDVVRYLGSLLMREDEVVLYRFEGSEFAGVASSNVRPSPSSGSSKRVTRRGRASRRPYGRSLERAVHHLKSGLRQPERRRVACCSRWTHSWRTRQETGTTRTESRGRRQPMNEHTRFIRVIAPGVEAW